jgi:hypothetical protein
VFAGLFRTIVNKSEESEIYKMVKECCVVDESFGDYQQKHDAKISLYKLNLLIDLFYHYPYLKK